MPKLSKTPHGTVTAVWGSAVNKTANGQIKQVAVGDVVHLGDRILTSQNGIVQINPAEQNEAATPAELDFDQLPAPSAGFSNNASALLEGFRAPRIVEALTPAGLAFPTENAQALVWRVGGDVNQAGTSSPSSNTDQPPIDSGTPAPLNQPPQAQSEHLSSPYQTPIHTPLIGHDSDGSVVSVTLTSPPAHGTLFLSDGVTPVQPGVPITPEQAAGLIFQPDPGFHGSTEIHFTVTDDDGAASPPATINIDFLPPDITPPSNLPPEAQSDHLSGPYQTPIHTPLIGHDSDGSVVSVTLTSPPAHGTLFLSDGVTPVQPGVPITPEQAAGLIFQPDPGFHGSTEIHFTVTDDDGAISPPATINIDFLPPPINHPPIAADDFGSLIEDGLTVLNVNASNGVIHSTPAPSGQDTDPDGDTLVVTDVRTGSETGTGTPGSLGIPLTGQYGTLTLHPDGSYTYVLNNSSPEIQNLTAGQVVKDLFSYTISDGHGGTDQATLTIDITGTQDLDGGPATLTPVKVGGLSGSYYGYNDILPAAPGVRTHQDDATANFGKGGPRFNLNSTEEASQIIDERNGLAGGSGPISGSSASAQSGAPDVTFDATKIDYGFSPTVDATLGSNATVLPRSSLPAPDLNPDSSTHGLSNFLAHDADSATAQTGAGNTNGTSGLGTTSDSVIRLNGQIYVQPGTYDFRVTADDGFHLTVAGQTLLEFDGNQWPTTRVFNNVPLGDLQGGMQSIELIYWEQGTNSRLRIEYKPSSEPASAYQVMSDTNTGLFSNESAVTLTDPRIQDLVYDTATSQWHLRTGSILDGDGGNNTLTGSEARDLLLGGAGNDTLFGNAGADQLDGGEGDDTLRGGMGSDLLIGGAGTNTLEGGLGDDTYRLSSGQDTLIEAANAGTDAIQLDATYTAAHVGNTYTLAQNFENLLAQGSANINLVGNNANNRIEGNSGDNVIQGGQGYDFLIGGAGNDTLTGGGQPDVFAWRLADAGPQGKPFIDTITDFRYSGGFSNVESGVQGIPTGGGDVLDLRDLLQGEHTTPGDIGSPVRDVEMGNILNYVDIQVTGANTTIHLSSQGGFAGGTFNAAHEDQRIVLANLDLYAATGASNDESLLIGKLIKNGTLVVD